MEKTNDTELMELIKLYTGTMNWFLLPLHNPIFDNGEVKCSCSNSQCSSIGKHPRLSYDYASNDVEVVSNWFKKWPNMNLAVLTGKESGIIVVDVDPDHGGNESLAEMQTQHGQLPETVMSLTGGGGNHILFNFPINTDEKLKNKINLYPGIDIRAERGLIVVEPSKHRKQKGYYWDTGYYPGEKEIADCPEWLLKEITETKSSFNKPINNQDEYGEGKRNSFLTSLAGSMIHRGMSLNAIEAALLAENKSKCTPPLSDLEVLAIAKSISKYPSSTIIENEKKSIEEQKPAPLKKDALYGLAGEFIKVIEPESEAHIAALLINFLLSFGNIIGRSGHFNVGGVNHYTNLFSILVGDSSKGRKGTSWGIIKQIFHRIDEGWTNERVLSGLSSGEGLIYNVRDKIVQIEDGEEKIKDAGVSDKRLLLLESEFGSVLKSIVRQGNTLSSIIRNAWDYGNLSNLVKNNPNKATDAHISIIGHITNLELRKYLNDNETGNGFANRFLWVYVERSKKLPFGGNPDWDVLEVLINQLEDVIKFSSSVKSMVMSPKCKELWVKAYNDFSEGNPGLLFGTITSRAEPQVLRLAIIYAILDKSRHIRVEHLKAALAVWDYSYQSAKYIFGDSLGDPVADVILEETKTLYPEYLNKKNIYPLFKNHKSKYEINRAINSLVKGNRLIQVKYETQGRPGLKYQYNPINEN